ncbi:MAG TPA: glutamate 5-kinase, partial [Acidimicrobiaceae bacterium]|nr:glutamate 5-kinase [Acidimicrobiaceae bacterium]
RVVVKIGTSSVTLGAPGAPGGTAGGGVDEAALAKLTAEVVDARRLGHEVIVVTSGAIAAGVERLGIARPTRVERLQAVSAVGQIDLMATYSRLFAAHGATAGQVLIAPHDFADRKQYVHAQATFEHLLALGVVPVVNENDAVADDAIRYGDNDRIAALVANLLGADMLVLLTDTAGLHTADPRRDRDATLIEEVLEVSAELERVAGRSGHLGSGGMASKLAAAKMASWSGVRTVIAAATRPDVLVDAIAGRPGVGTVVAARDTRLAARKLWIGFAVASAGTLVVDDGARRAMEHGGKSLLAAGVTDVAGKFGAGDAVEVRTADGPVFAKGIAAMGAARLAAVKGKRSADIADGTPALVIHRDDLVVLPAD